MSEPDQIGVALLVGRALETAGCAWMIGGSLATSVYGEPRSTHDVDLVADLRSPGVERFIAGLREAFYVDREAVDDAVRRGASFNVIHFETTEKVDVFVVRGSRFARGGLDAREQIDLGDGRTAPVAAPAHMVVEKLRWYRRGGEVSDRQWRDVLGVLQTSGDRLDLAEMRVWAAELGVDDLLERVLVEAGMAP